MRRVLRPAAAVGDTSGIECEVFHDQIAAPYVEVLHDRAATNPRG
jgi:hypothetical protein